MKVYQNQGQAIYCYNGVGPVFGGNLHELYISINPYINRECCSNIGHTYKLPSGQTATNFLTGDPNFNVSEIEVDEKVKEIHSILKWEVQRLRQEKEAFDSVAKKLEHVHFSDTIKLNVGGQFCTTSLQTLTKDAGSMLHAMFSGRFDTKPAEDGSYFIDRDGTYFRYILNYLRNGKLLLPDDKLVEKEVLEEAKFYQIQGIVNELTAKPSGPPPLQLSKLYDYSRILSTAQRIYLSAIHGEDQKFKKCTLLYRGSRDGWASSIFHSKCDSFSGPTMVVIKSTWGYIFGGYTEQSWAGSGNYKADNTAFLFSLVNYSGITPIVQMKPFQNHGNAIYCNNGYGPTFGGNYDLYICDNPQSNNCSSNIGDTYKLPSGQTANTFLTGGQYFKLSEMEVYGLQN
ncbi:BTB/POZ domain-containing protein KCTD21 [Exaiptasia diaphana]|nr:BTB/POZ domain-containing protein KCTD21 [Exaiptasia diaphana]